MKVIINIILISLLITNVVNAQKVEKKVSIDAIIDLLGPPKETQKTGNRTFYIYIYKPNENDPALHYFSNKKYRNDGGGFLSGLADSRLNEQCIYTFEVNNDDFVINYWRQGDGCN